MLRRCLWLIALVLLGARPSLAANNATFMSQTVPTTLAAGQTSTVSIRMQNTGTTTWTSGTLGYKLGTQNPQDNTLWTGSTRVLLAPGETIAPGQQKTFTFNITAPASPGLYGFQWRMLHESVEWFGDFTPAVIINVTSAPVDDAQFVSQSMPASLYVGETRSVSVTMRNTGSTTWTRTAGIKLGSENPRDNTTWGLNRVLLPTQPVAPGQQVTFTFNITAPSFAGTYNSRWRMLREGVAWFGQLTPNVPVQVIQGVTVCPGVQIGFDDGIDDAPAIRQCIQGTPAGGTLQLPAGTYDVGSQIVIDKTMTLRTSGTSGSTYTCQNYACATLKALPSFNSGGGGFLVAQNASGVTIDHIVLDGNRAGRLQSPAAAECAKEVPGANRWGFNARMSNCSGCRFTYNVSKNALCGTALEFSGHDATISNNAFHDNGQNSARLMWADGLTVIYSDRAVITNNTLGNNSDVALILGGGRGAYVANNQITQFGQVAFAGLMLFNFENQSAGDFTDAVVTQNRIDCGSNRNCHFGIMLGPHPWNPSLQIAGGTVYANTVFNALQGINVEGAGTAANPLTLYNNIVSSPPGTPTTGVFLCGTRQTSPLNIYHSVVNRNGDTMPATNWLWHDCP